MKLKSLKWAVCGLVAALTLMTASSVMAQAENGGGGGATGDRNGGGPGGQRQRRWDPAQMMEQMMTRLQDELAITNDTDWSAVQPLVQKVVEAQREARGPGMARLFGRGQRGGNGGDQGGRPQRMGGMFGQTSPEADALQKAIDDNAPAGQVKDLLAKYQASQKAKQAKLEAAQADLRAVLTVKQEASATLLGLL